jgi:hypothetical protein
MSISAIRNRTSNLEATGSTPVGRAKYTPELRHFMPMQATALQSPVGTMRKRAAQSGTILSQFWSQSFSDRSGFCDPSRVKRCATAQTHGNSPLSIERLPERGENMGYIDAGFTADAPQGEYDV